MKIPTVSGLARAMKCRASLSLPQSHRESKISALGSAIHAYLEHGGDFAKVPAQFRAECERIDLRDMPIDGAQFAHEVAYALLPGGSAIELGRGLGRNYEAAPDGSICGTADAVGVADRRRVIVIDYKSGFADLGPVAENIQLGTYALMAARAHGCDSAIVGVIHARPDAPIWAEWAELDAFALDEIESRLAALSKSIADGQPSDPVEGEHCKYCPAFGSCPAKIKLALSLGAVDEPRAQELTKDNAPKIYARLKMVEQMAERVRETLEDWARSNPIALDGGKIYGQREHVEHRIDPDVAMPTLLAAIGPEAEGEIVVRKSISQEVVKKLLRPRLEGKSMKEVYGYLWTALEAAGAIREIKSTRFGEFKPRNEGDIDGVS